MEAVALCLRHRRMPGGASPVNGSLIAGGNRLSMPMYDYVCQSCGHRFEAWQKITDDPLEVCPECGSPVRRVLYPVGLVFKGGGFYKTDSRGTSMEAVSSDSAGGETKGAGSAGESKGSESKGSESKESESKGSESKGS